MALGYRELAGVLRAAIEGGDYHPGTTLPKQADIARRYGVNVNTVRKAVGVLEAEGLVDPVRRRGTVVRPRPPMSRLGVERYAKSKWKFGNVVAFGADREASGQPWKPTDQTNTVRKVDADEEVAEALTLAAGSPVYERERLVRDDTRPTHLLTSYYRPSDVEGTPLVDPSPGPAGRGGGYMILTLQGMEPEEITESFYARMPTPDGDASSSSLPASQS